MSPDGEAVNKCISTILDTIRKHVTPVSPRGSTSSRVLTIKQANANAQLASELLQILTDIYQRFPLAIAQSPELQSTSLATLQEVFAYPRLSVRKRAVPALAAFISVCPSQFHAIKDDMTRGFASGGDSAKAWVAAVAGLAKTSSSSDVGALVANGGLADVIMKQTENLEDTDAVEGALTVGDIGGIELTAGFGSSSSTLPYGGVWRRLIHSDPLP